jgi:hypothetical protein
MPSLPDLPGKGLVCGASRRAKLITAAAGLGALALGGVVVRRVLNRGGPDAGIDSDPIAETPTAPSGSEKKEVPKAAPKSERKGTSEDAEAAAPEEKPAPANDSPNEPEDEEPPPPEERTIPVPHPEPPLPTGTDAPPNAVEPGNISADKEPHHALNNPVGEPDETEYPDPFEKRDDPRDPPDPDGEPFGEEPHPATGSESTSEPPSSQDPDRAEPPQRDKLDD